MAQGNKQIKAKAPYQKPKQKGKAFTRKASKNLCNSITCASINNI